MSDIIHRLPDSVANQIAAGEVIPRPAAVVKELVENAVDAGATEIQIVIKDAGRSLIQVIDNGKGMTPTDARMAFERHATSKIMQASDLSSLHTMGFRGEALPSICAIAQVELRTMPTDAELGTRLLINGSKIELQEPAVCTRGSNFMVKNLFFNTPARRKFMKSDQVELGAIMREFERLALVNNHLRLTLNAGSRQIDLRPGSFKQRIADLWKGNLDKQLLPLEVDTAVGKITGFISHPQYARRRGALQFLIVNGRNMRHLPYHKAILSCYEHIIAHDTQPNYFLKFEVDPAKIDVNVHPTKNEIKFSEESHLRSVLVAAVRSALGKFAEAPSIDFTQDVMELDPARDGSFVAAPSQGIDPNYNPFAATSDFNPASSGNRNPFASPAKSSGSSYRPKDTAAPKNWESLYTSFMSDGADIQQASAAPADTSLPGMDNAPAASSMIQVGDKYILMPGKDGLCIIDQHRAHVKVLFNKYMHDLATGSDALATQRLAFPETITLTPTRSLLLESITEDMSRLGFIISHGNEPGEWQIEGMPALLRTENVTDTIEKIIDTIAGDVPASGNKVSEPATQDILQGAALVMARAAAIRRGQRLSAAEMDRLVADLFALPDPNYTPSGNLVIRTLPIGRLDSLFS